MLALSTFQSNQTNATNSKDFKIKLTKHAKRIEIREIVDNLDDYISLNTIATHFVIRNNVLLIINSVRIGNEKLR